MASTAIGEQEAIRNVAVELTRASEDYAALLEVIGDARFVLIGEASHGTHDFYHARAELTKRLIEQRGFAAVAAEADWPDALRVNRYVRGESGDTTADEALADFRQFPSWMWRNSVVLAFTGWLRDHNQGLPPERSCGFYGLDLYSLHASAEAVLAYLDNVDPDAAREARARYACFDHFGDDAQRYGYATSYGGFDSCEEDVVQQLVELRRNAGSYMHRDGRAASDELFYAQQNAALVKNAEAYYRTMYRSDVSSWNLRDRHMAETLDALAAYLDRGGQRSKIVVWAHNSHLGNARATEMTRRGELNLGQLVREQHGDDARLIGFTTHHGTVTAATDWGGNAERKIVRPALAGSYEALFHETGLGRFLLPLDARADDAIAGRRLERAIGVIYRPESERVSHYFNAQLTQQFDAVVHFDDTRALEPLERASIWDAGEAPQTFPWSE
jgi:erythromycin esterase-like protein